MNSSRMVILSLGISLLAILVIFNFTQTSLTWRVIYSLDWDWMMIAILLQAVFWFLWGVRLKMISDFMDCKISLMYSFKISLASAFLAAITPSSAGGEPLRVKMIADYYGYGKATAAVIAERVLDAIYFAMALPVFIFLSGISSGFGVKVAVGFIMCLAAFLFLSYIILKDEKSVMKLTSPIYRVMKKFKGEERAAKLVESIGTEILNFRGGVKDLLKNPLHRIFLLFFTTAILWTTVFLIPSFILLALHYKPFFLLSYTVQLIVIVLSLIPLTPGATGIAEVSAAYFYSTFVPSHLVGVLIGIWRATTYYLSMIIGFAVNVQILREYTSVRA